MSRGGQMNRGGGNMNRNANRGPPAHVGFLLAMLQWRYHEATVDVMTFCSFSPSSSSREEEAVETLGRRTATMATTGTAGALATGTAWTRLRPSTRAGSKGSVFPALT